MLSESARMSSAAEARYRVQAPNSKPRAITVVALDAEGERVVRDISSGRWQNARFFTSRSSDDTLIGIAGTNRTIAEEVDASDLVVLVAGPGGRADLAPSIGQACSAKRVMTTGFVVGAAGASDAELAKTLAQLRPWSLMVVIANSDEYIADMMTALRA